jgi:pyrroline-5-carboxylate reductase
MQRNFTILTRNNSGWVAAAEVDSKPGAIVKALLKKKGSMGAWPQDHVRVRNNKRDIARLFEELNAAPTSASAEDILADADWLFVGMDSAKREELYAQIEDIISGIPED